MEAKIVELKVLPLSSLKAAEYNSYSVAEISAMIGVSVTTVNVWLRGGVMPYYVVGQQRRVKKSDFRAWLKAQSKYHVTKNR